MKKIIYSLIGACCLVACGGVGSSSSSGFQDDPIPLSPNAPVGNYLGVAYSALGQPTGFSQAYPSSFWPSSNNSNIPAFQIAYGSKTRYRRENSELSKARQKLGRSSAWHYGDTYSDEFIYFKNYNLKILKIEII